MAELEIRALRDDDTGQVVELLRLTLGQGTVPRTRAFWDWKHRENPFGPSPGMVALHAGELIGLRVFLRWRWQNGVEALPAVRAVDTATHPEWQGRGIFRRLTEDLVEQLRGDGTAFVFNTPNRQSRAGYLKMGWQELGRIGVLVRPTGLGALLGTFSLTTGGLAASEDFPPASELLSQSQLQPLLEACEGAAARAGGLSTPRSVEYLRWRYVQCPERDYWALWDLDAKNGAGDAGAALIFRGRERFRRREIALCEILVGPGQNDRARAKRLIQRVARSGGADYLIGVAAPRSPARSVLRRSGFWFSAPGPSFTVRSLAAPAPDRSALERWWLSVGDLELF